MTTFFKILMAIILLLAPIIFVGWRTNRLKKQKEILESIVASRTSEIQTKNEQLNDLNSTKVKLFSIISHDLRSPFNSILGFQEYLIDEYNNLTDDERLDMLNKAHSSSRQVYTLVENLLNWSLLQTNAIQYIPEKFNLYSVLHDKVCLYQTQAELKGITFKEDIAQNLYAFADINLLQTSFRNLITNAIKFTPNGGCISVKAIITGDKLEISVTDTGKGMSNEEMKELFSIVNLKTKRGTNGEKGTGLGLLLCKEFIEKNKGNLTIISDPEKGSTFSFTVPSSIY
jgi:signal transduction histidine kinase